MQAVILVGGIGSRLGDAVSSTPKPLLDVCGRPFVETVILNLRRFGFDDFILLAGYKADVVVDRYGPESDFSQTLGATLRIVLETEPLGTAGAVRQAAPYLDHQFLLLNGDSIFDFNYLDLCLCEREGEPDDWLLRVALLEVDDASRYGLVELSGPRVSAFREKPDEAVPGVVNSGVYWMKAEVLEHIPDTPCSLEQEVFPALMGARSRVVGRCYRGYFIDIGIPADLQRARDGLTESLRKPAAFLDRDGTLNIDEGYTHKIESFIWVDHAKAAVKALNDAGFLVFVVTNQAGIARGYYQAQDVERLHDWMQSDLRRDGAHIDDIRYCPHHPEGSVAPLTISCDCRKPGTAMLDSLIAQWQPVLESSFMLGDSEKDAQAGQAVGIHSEQIEVGTIAGAIDRLIGERVVESRH